MRKQFEVKRMNIELFKEKLEQTREKIEVLLSNTPIKAEVKVYFENSKHERCERESKECRYVNGDIHCLPEGAEENDAYLFGICLYMKGDELIYPSSKKYAPSAEEEVAEMLNNALEYAEALSKSEDPVTDMAYDRERSRAFMAEYERNVEKMKKRSLIILGVGFAAIAAVLLISLL